MSRNRFWNAHMIQQGACNPSGIARALVEACDQANAELDGTDSVRRDPAVRLICHQLASLLNLSEYDRDLAAFSRDYALCEARGRMTDQQAEALARLCERYGVPFQPTNFAPHSSLPEGWLQGAVGPITVGCSPAGEISS